MAKLSQEAERRARVAEIAAAVNAHRMGITSSFRPKEQQAMIADAAPIRSDKDASIAHDREIFVPPPRSPEIVTGWRPLTLEWLSDNHPEYLRGNPRDEASSLSLEKALGRMSYLQAERDEEMRAKGPGFEIVSPDPKKARAEIVSRWGEAEHHALVGWLRDGGYKAERERISPLLPHVDEEDDLEMPPVALGGLIRRPGPGFGIVSPETLDKSFAKMKFHMTEEEELEALLNEAQNPLSGAW
jgi:hypothetical protein